MLLAFGDERGVVTTPLTQRKKVLSSEDEDDVEALENFFTKMKTPSKAAAKRDIPEVPTADFIVPDSEELSAETSLFERTTILNPDTIYSSDSDDEDGENRETFGKLEDTVIEISSSDDDVFDNLPKTPKNLPKKTLKTPKRYLPKVSEEMTPENIKSVLRERMKSSSSEPPSLGSPVDKLLRRQVVRDFSPNRKPKPKFTPKKMAPIKKNPKTKCGFYPCILEGLGAMDAKTFRRDLNTIIIELYKPRFEICLFSSPVVYTGVSLH